MKIFEWLDHYHLDYEKLDERSFKCDDKTFFEIFPKDDKLFDDDFGLILDSFDEHYVGEFDYVVFSFGGNYYYTSLDGQVQLNPLLYIGKSKDIIDFDFLGVHGKYEILNGSRDYVDWCKKAKFLGVKSMGICEKNTLAGLPAFQIACDRHNLKSIAGAYYTVKVDSMNSHSTKFFAKNQSGYQKLLFINKKVNVDNSGYIDISDLEFISGGDLIVILDPKSLNYDSKVAKSYNKMFIDCLYYQLDCINFSIEERDKSYLLNLQQFIKSDIKPVLISDAYYLEKSDSEIKKILNGVSSVKDYDSDDQYFKNLDEQMLEFCKISGDSDKSIELFQNAINNLKEVCDQCDFKLVFGDLHLPEYELTDDQVLEYGDKINLFWSIIEKGFSDRLTDIDIDLYNNRLEREISLIVEGNFIDYFLILWDILKWCRDNEILTGFGRGSSGGSLVCYLMYIIDIDPLKYDLLFERFLNENRINKSLADIDSDIEGLRRDDVKRYIEQRFGYEQVCSVGTYGNMKLKMSLSDIGKSFNVDFATIKVMNAILGDEMDDDGKTWIDIFRVASRSSKVKAFVQSNPHLVNLTRLCLMQPRSKSIHTSAVLIFPKEKTIYEWIPVYKSEKDGKEFLLSEWEGEFLDKCGYLKEDILGIAQLDKFSNIIKLIKQNKGITVDFKKVPLDDRNVYQYFCNGWNEDVFQFGTKGLKSYCRDVQPYNIKELIAINALYRPGAMQSNAHNDFVSIKFGKKIPEYDYMLEEVTKETYGLYIYQEQVMLAAQKLANYTLTEADVLRKIMLGASKKQDKDKFKFHENRFIEEAIKNGCNGIEAENIWNKLEQFASYGFNKSHSCAYAITGYVCQWFKYHYPLEFWTTSIQFSKDKEIDNKISEINKIGSVVSIDVPEINKSEKDFRSDTETNKIYWSLSKIKNCGDVAVDYILNERLKNGEFFSFEEFLKRVEKKKVNSRVVSSLVLSGCFDKIEDIKEPKGRIDLFKKYDKMFGKNSDVKTNNLKYNYQWLLRQKELSELAYFDYKKLYKQFIKENLTGQYIDTDILYQEQSAVNRLKCCIGGVINEIIVKESKKGEYCKVILEINYDFVQIMMWSDIWMNFKNIIVGSEGKIMFVNGRVSYDNYRKENVLQTEEYTQIKILE